LSTSGDGITPRTSPASGITLIDSNNPTTTSKWETLSEFVSRRLVGLGGLPDRISGLNYNLCQNGDLNLTWQNSANDLRTTNIRCWLAYPDNISISGYLTEGLTPGVFDNPIDARSWLSYTGCNTSLVGGNNAAPSTNEPLRISGNNYRIMEIGSASSKDANLSVKIVCLP
jgi:hypothetical protein